MVQIKDLKSGSLKYYVCSESAEVVTDKILLIAEIFFTLLDNRHPERDYYNLVNSETVYNLCKLMPNLSVTKIFVEDACKLVYLTVVQSSLNVLTMHKITGHKAHYGLSSSFRKQKQSVLKKLIPAIKSRLSSLSFNIKDFEPQSVELVSLLDNKTFRKKVEQDIEKVLKLIVNKSIIDAQVSFENLTPESVSVLAEFLFKENNLSPDLIKDIVKIVKSNINIL